MASSLPHKNIVKKRTARFIRFKAHQYKRLATVRYTFIVVSWRVRLVQ